MISIWKSILEWYRNNRKTLRLSLLVSLAITIFSYEVAEISGIATRSYA